MPDTLLGARKKNYKEINARKCLQLKDNYPNRMRLGWLGERRDGKRTEVGCTKHSWDTGISRILFQA